ncbi:hypothetical protein Tco_1149055 [Tanacetum coccineum]
MKKKRNLLLNRKLGSHLILFCRNSLIALYEFTMEKLLFVVRSMKEVINLESLLLYRNEDLRELIWDCNISHFGVIIQVGSVRATAKVTEGSVFSFTPYKKRRGRALQMSGTDTTSSNARRPLEDTRDQSMSIPGRESRASTPSSAGEASPDLRSANSVRIDFIQERRRPWNQ